MQNYIAKSKMINKIFFNFTLSFCLPRRQAGIMHFKFYVSHS